MDRFPQMLYRAGGAEQIHGGRFSTLIVNDAESLEAALAGGWHETTPAALEAAANPPEQLKAPADDAPPTRAELEQKALELGIKLDGRWGDKRIGDEIAKKLAELAA